MSHFNLAIFTLDENPNLDEIMEPFFEGNRVEPYIDMTKSELIEDARRQMQCIFETRYAEWKAHPSEYEKGVNPSHIEYLKKNSIRKPLKAMRKMTSTKTATCFPHAIQTANGIGMRWADAGTECFF